MMVFTTFVYHGLRPLYLGAKEKLHILLTMLAGTCVNWFLDEMSKWHIAIQISCYRTKNGAKSAKLNLPCLIFSLFSLDVYHSALYAMTG